MANDPYLFQTVKEAADITEVARRYGLEPDRNGWCRCPFHGERTASFHLYNQRYKCFGCGAGGDAVDLVAGVRGIDPLEAVRELNAVLGLGIDLDAPVDTEAVERAARARAERQRFKAWREGVIQALTACFYNLWQTIVWSGDTPATGVSEAHSKALKYLSVVEYYLNIVCFGSEDEVRESRHILDGIVRKIKEAGMDEKR